MVVFQDTLFFACWQVSRQEPLSPPGAVEGDGETMGFVVGQENFFLEVFRQRLRSNQTLWLMLGIFHYAHNRNVTWKSNFQVNGLLCNSHLRL